MKTVLEINRFLEVSILSSIEAEKKKRMGKFFMNYLMIKNLNMKLKYYKK